MEAKFDRGSIQSVIAQRQHGLYPCFKEEARRQPGLNDRIPIEFVIGNDGQVKKLWVDNPRFQDGPLPDCLLKELQRWPFHPYEGQQATVGLSFTIGGDGRATGFRDEYLADGGAGLMLRVERPALLRL